MLIYKHKEIADAIEELESNEVENSIPEETPSEPSKEPMEPIFKAAPKEKVKEEPIITVDSVKEPKAKKECAGGTGWKIATIILALFAIAGCGGLCYLFFVDGTTNILGRTITSSQTKPVTPSKPAEKPEEPAKPSADDIDLASLKKILQSSPDLTVTIRASGLTKDNKYYYAMASANIEGVDGAWSTGTWYRKAEKGSKWTLLLSNNDSNLMPPACSELTAEQYSFILNYSYIAEEGYQEGVYENDIVCREDGELRSY